MVMAMLYAVSVAVGWRALGAFGRWLLIDAWPPGFRPKGLLSDLSPARVRPRPRATGTKTMHRRMIRSTLTAMLVWTCLATSGEAFTLTFSGSASDEDAEVALFDAALSLTVDAAAGESGDDLLVLDLANRTSGSDGYTLSALYLNYVGAADPDTFFLVVDPLGGGALKTGERLHAGGFGYYDLLLDLSMPPRANGGLDAGSTATWKIDLGTTGVNELDFGALSSTPSPRQIAGVAALKFTQGPEGDSTFVIPGFSDDPRVPPNSAVPEPLSATLVGSALLGLIVVRTRVT